MEGSENEIDEAFEITGGPQAIITAISANEPIPASAGDSLKLQSPDGRTAMTKIESIEYALKPGGREFYGFTLLPPRIDSFTSFRGGTFIIESEGETRD